MYNYLYLDSFLFFIFYLFIPYKRENYTNMKKYNLNEVYNNKNLYSFKTKKIQCNNSETSIILILIYKLYSLKLTTPLTNVTISNPQTVSNFCSIDTPHFYKNELLFQIPKLLYTITGKYKYLNFYLNVVNNYNYTLPLNLKYKDTITSLYASKLLSKYNMLNKTFYGDLLKYNSTLKYFNIYSHTALNVLFKNIYLNKNNYQK